MIVFFGWFGLIAVMVALLYIVISKWCELLDISMNNRRTSLPSYRMSPKEKKEWEQRMEQIINNNLMNEIKDKLSSKDYNKFFSRFTIKTDDVFINIYIEDNITKETYNTMDDLDVILNKIKIKLRKETIEELL